MMYRLLKTALLRLLRAPANPPDPPAGTPESVVVFRASQRFLRLHLVVLALWAVPTLILFGGLTVVAAVARGKPLGFAILLMLSAALCGLRYFAIRIDYDMRYYIITDRSLRIRRGAFNIVESTYTYANVQNVTLHQGPLERLLGISNVLIQTAGGGGAPQTGQTTSHSGVLAGVDNAEELRDRVLVLLRAYRDAGLGDREDRTLSAQDEPLPAARLAEILQEIQMLRGALRPTNDAGSSA